jgi:hypothetical protein
MAPGAVKLIFPKNVMMGTTVVDEMAAMETIKFATIAVNVVTSQLARIATVVSIT